MLLHTSQGALGNQNQDGRWTPSDFTDIRVDEDYERFYRAQAASGKKLPPPLDNRTIYNELPQHMSQGLSVQAQAALAHRLQAGGVNGLNGGMQVLPSNITPKAVKAAARLDRGQADQMGSQYNGVMQA